jgi:hypothetical protein
VGPGADTEPGGPEWTPAEFAAPSAPTGFRPARVVPTVTALNMIEGAPARGGAAKG